MTQEQKTLLLKDLCSRLPYGVVIQDKCLVHDDNFLPNKEEDTLIDIDVYSGILMTNGGSFYEVDEMKPYLFPLSSMTEEQEKDIFDNGKFYINRHNSLCRFPKYENDYDFVTMEDCLDIFNKFNKYHLDYRGFIPDGLAEDATGLNIY